MSAKIQTIDSDWDRSINSYYNWWDCSIFTAVSPSITRSETRLDLHLYNLVRKCIDRMLLRLCTRFVVEIIFLSSGLTDKCESLWTQVLLISFCAKLFLALALRVPANIVFLVLPFTLLKTRQIRSRNRAREMSRGRSLTSIHFICFLTTWITVDNSGKCIFVLISMLGGVIEKITL